MTIDETWVAAPFAPGFAPLRPTIFRVVSPIKEPIGESLEIPEPARLDFGYGKLWAAQSMGHDWLTRIDPETLERTTVPEPGGSRHDIDSDLEVSVGAGAVWTHVLAYSSLIRVDPSTARVTGEWPIAGTQAVIEATEDLGVFVMIHRSQAVSRLYRIDPNSGETLGETMDFAGPGPFALESGFGSLWVADQSHDKVYRIEVGEKVSPEVEHSATERRQIKELMKLIQELEEKRHAYSEGANFEYANGELTKEEKRAYQRRIDALEQAILKAQAKLESQKED
ncbi:MAG TPA: hypothetical protein VEV82_03360 [Actinomycetota bacterium]|nr:hypothetical protein [Actinomycetota bacterium]